MPINKLHIIIPVHNEGKSIYDLLSGFNEIIQKLTMPASFLVINDCSSDDSKQFIEKAQQDFDLEIRAINHETNRGLQGALITGLNELRDLSDNDVVITLDGDNTHNPFLIKHFLDKLNEGADIVIASRYCEQSRIYGLSRFRMILSWGAKVLYSIKWRIPGVKDYTCNFRGYKSSLINSALKKYGADFITEKGFTATTEILKKLNEFHPIIVEVPMILKYSNKENPSNMNVFKTIFQTLRVLVKI